MTLLMIGVNYTLTDLGYSENKVILDTGRKAPSSVLLTKFCYSLFKFQCYTMTPVILVGLFVGWFHIFTYLYILFFAVNVIYVTNVGSYRYAELSLDEDGILHYKVHGYIYGDYEWSVSNITTACIKYARIESLSDGFGKERLVILDNRGRADLLVKKALVLQERNNRDK